VHKDYVKFAKVLKEILEKAASLYAPNGVVQVRPKEINSFAEKLIRKDKYIKPLEEITDLCGARLICHFSSEVEKVSEFIRENFEVDELNSLDVKSRLNVGEFGYRSVHYVVTPRQATILGINIPEKLWSLKAEIQVRTFNEHIWADVFHDRIYKTQILIPNEWKREAARLAAILENADNSFLKMSDIIDQLTINYLPTPDLGKVANEKEILHTLIDIQNEVNDKSTGTRIKLAQINILEGDWDGVINTLNPVTGEIEKITNNTTIGKVYYELGFAHCYKNKNNLLSNAFQNGIDLLNKSISILEKENSKHDLAKAWYYKGKALQLDNTKNKDLVREAFNEAYQLVCESPYYYMSFLIEDIFNPADNRIDLDLVSSRLRKCISDCTEHVEAGIEVIQALFTIIKAAIVLNDSTLALNTYLKTIDFILHDNVVFSQDQVEDNIRDINQIVHLIKREGESIVLLGHLLLWKKYNNQTSFETLKSIRKSPPVVGEEVLIIAGYGLLNDNMMDLYDAYILETLRDFSGTVISGGTHSGIPGLVGNKTGRLSMTGNKNYTLLGYRPGTLPDFVKEDVNYDFHITSENRLFSFYDVLMYWLDILFAKTNPENILLAGFGGGTISLLEYKMALAMDVKVALLQDTGGALTEIQHDNYWNYKTNLMIVPDDKYTFWALSNRNKKTVLPNNVIDILAKQIHAYYLGLSTLKRENPEHYNAIKDWEWKSLDPNLKVSNNKQAEFIEHMLKRVGLSIRKANNPQLFVIDEKFKDYQKLAELEHARWNAERLLSGWKPGNDKDVANKISPYIKRWQLLPENIKKYDYEAVRRFPEMLGEVGYEII
jgi:ppGpp synthetase/RelA/SpoT-type nucleotidyltranferase